ncbi:MAG: hypothetical protein HKM86_11310, partial [Deltaproteobacteria bacterium]|nr:hypothetical protein [Deltaproteobacteria bacterium]
VGPGSPYHLLALYSLGQIAAGGRDLNAEEELFRRMEQEDGGQGGKGNFARKTERSRAEILITTGRGAEAAPLFEAHIAAERRDVDAAEELFRRVEREAGGPGGNGNLARRAARLRAQILIATGRGAEAEPMFEALLREENNPLDRIGLASAGTGPVSALERLPAEITAGLPLKERIQYLLLFGGLARKSGRHALAVERLTRAGEELTKAIFLASPPPPEFRVRSDTLESLRLQIERLRLLRQMMESTESRAEEAVRADGMELLAGLLVADWTVSRAARETPSARVRFLTPVGIEEVVRRIEEVALYGVNVDRYVEQLSAALDVLRNASHPSVLYRDRDRREKNREKFE